MSEGGLLRGSGLHQGASNEFQYIFSSGSSQPVSQRVHCVTSTLRAAISCSCLWKIPYDLVPVPYTAEAFSTSSYRMLLPVVVNQTEQREQVFLSTPIIPPGLPFFFELFRTSN